MQPNPFGQQPPAPAAPPNPFGGQPAAPVAPPAPPQQYPDPWGQQPASAPPAPPAPAYPPQQQYAPQASPQQAAQPFPGMGPQGGQMGGDPFRPPAPQVDRPRVQDLFGCLLLVLPKRIEYGVTSRFRDENGPQKQDRMTADVVVLYGPTNSPHGGSPQQVPYGGAPEKTGNQRRPHDKMFAVPGKIDAMYISNKGLISQCREALQQTERGQGQGMVLGWLDQGEAQGDNNPPWILRPYGEQEAAMARQWLQANPTI